MVKKVINEFVAFVMRYYNTVLTANVRKRRNVIRINLNHLRVFSPTTFSYFLRNINNIRDCSAHFTPRSSKNADNILLQVFLSCGLYDFKCWLKYLCYFGPINLPIVGHLYFNLV